MASVWNCLHIWQPCLLFWSGNTVLKFWSIFIGEHCWWSWCYCLSLPARMDILFENVLCCACCSYFFIFKTWILNGLRRFILNFLRKSNKTWKEIIKNVKFNGFSVLMRFLLVSTEIWFSKNECWTFLHSQRGV